MESRPAPPPIRLPVFYAGPPVIAALAYAYDLAAGAKYTVIAGYGVDRWALITAGFCVIEAAAATAYLVPRRFVSATLVLLLYLAVFGAVAIGLGSFVV